MAPTNQAVVIVGPKEAKVVDVPYPTIPADDYMVVRTTAVAINPTDWKHVELSEQQLFIGCHSGCDYAGVVEEVGPGVTKGFKKGDRVCGSVNGANEIRKQDGSFAKYIAVKSSLSILTPDNITDEQASTLGVAIPTIGQSLYQTLKLPLPTTPTQEKTPILIYGGSTAMGISGIQFAAQSGLTVITTGSPHNHEYLRSLGAAHVVDYKSPTAVDGIRAAAAAAGGGSLRLAWDCQGDKASGAFCGRCLVDNDKEGTSHYASLLFGTDAAVKKESPGTKTSVTVYYSVFGEDYFYKTRVPAVPEDEKFAAMFWEVARDLLAEGKVKPIRTEVNRGGEGLEGALVGMKELQAGKVSGAKLVYTL